MLNVEQAIMNSCNDCLMQISRLEGIDTFCKYQSLFGFGMRSGIDLPGEASCEGLLYTVDNMTMEALATNSFGQNFNVNAMQMVAGFSALINGGNYYKPHVIKQIVNEKGGIVQSFDKQLIKQVVTKDTSDFLKQALCSTVAAGTGKTAAVAGYSVGGKTGTAQHLDKTDDSYLLSFLGFAPYEKPQIVCYAIVDSPDVDDPGSSSYACKLFSAVMTEVLPYMNIFPETDVVSDDSQNQDSQNADAAQPADGSQSQDGTDNQDNTAGSDTDNTDTDNANTDNTQSDDSNEFSNSNDNQNNGTTDETEYSPSEDENYEPDNPAIDYDDVNSIIGGDAGQEQETEDNLDDQQN